MTKHASPNFPVSELLTAHFAWRGDRLVEKLSEAMKNSRKVRLKAPQGEGRAGIGGPRTPEGKATSCLNNLRHGLAGSFRIIDHEPQEHFDAVRQSLREEHQPVSATEELLIQRMAEHYWLSRRAQQLQNTALLANATRNFALMLRYQITNDRGFHRCLTELLKLKKQRREAELEAQRSIQAAPAARHYTANETPSSAGASLSCAFTEEFESQNPHPLENKRLAAPTNARMPRQIATVPETETSTRSRKR